MIADSCPCRVPFCGSPDNPFLYVLETSTGGDVLHHALRHARVSFRPGTRQAVSQRQGVLPAGFSLTLHRFFGDPNAAGFRGTRPGCESYWPRSPTACTGTPSASASGRRPQQWLDIADEAGLLLQYEFPIWGHRSDRLTSSGRADEIVRQFDEFMRDNWNHPERGYLGRLERDALELSGREGCPGGPRARPLRPAWENGYEQPATPGDPYEDTPTPSVRTSSASRPTSR